MAVLKNADSAESLSLGHHTRIGRSRDADICIDDRRISAEHAVIIWNQGLWEVKDLGSRNGTVVDGRRLEPGVRFPLKAGSVIRFGSPEEHWILESADPPDVVAIDIEGRTVLEGEQGLLQFADGAVVCTDNGTEYWCESGEGRMPVSDRQVIEQDGRSWRLSIPPPGESALTTTAEGVLLSHEVTLFFRVSQDQDSVRVSIMAEGVRKDLRSRSFDHLLLALARARLKDEKTDLPVQEQGWVFAEELAKELSMDVGHVNVDIYRARRRFADAGIQGADEMLERRLQTRALRLGCAHVEIVQNASERPDAARGSDAS